MSESRILVPERMLQEAVTRVSDLIRRYATEDANDRTLAWSEFEAYLGSLVREGWDRGDIYEVVEHAYFRNDASAPSLLVDHFGDYLGGLAGHCDPSFIPQFPGEKMEANDLIGYARSLKWMKREEYEKRRKAAQLGAIDNPDDAQRLLEDH